MAWRIDESIIRGEIDNRTRGHVTGRLWLVGYTEPVELTLTGNAWRDLAGRRLEFKNPEPKPGDLDGLNLQQHGSIGDLTASRKVKVPEIPLDQIGVYYAAKKPFPWHWGNSLYLEWFSESNGRVVIESASYELKIVGEPTWEMTAAEEKIQHTANADATNDFLTELSAAVDGDAAMSEEYFEDDGDDHDEDDEEIAEDEPTYTGEKPQTEEEAATTQAWGDRLVDHIRARITREGETADYEQVLEEEIARLEEEHGEPDPTTEQLARHAAWLEEMKLAGKQAVTDEAPSEAVKNEHPLAAKAFDLAMQMMSETNARGWLKEDEGDEHPVAELVDSVYKASAQLGHALNREKSRPPIDRCAWIIVRLIKARVRMDDALHAMESCQEQKLLPNDWLASVMVEVIDLAHDTDIIIAKLRARLKRCAE